MKSILPRSLACLGLALALSTLTAQAASGTWINSNGGTWTDPANWSGSAIADGADSTADFSTITLSYAPTVTLDGTRTIGNLVLGDLSNANGWTLSPGSGDPLTLAVSSGSPVITVNNQTNTISLVLAGNQGFTKAGSGTLVLSGVNTYTGGTAISDGVLSMANVNSLGSDAVTFGGGTLNLGYTVAAPTIVNALNVPAGQSGIFDVTGSGAANKTLTIGTGPITINGTLRITRAAGNTGGTYFSSVSPVVLGSGTLEIGNTQSGATVGGTGVQGRCWFENLNAFANFTGAFHVLGSNGGGNLCFFNASQTTTNQTLTIDAGGYVTLVASTAVPQTTRFGGLNGGGTFWRNTAVNSIATLSVGNGNADGSFSGTILGNNLNEPGLGLGIIALTKAGTGTQTLSGTNFYTGATTISGGTLTISGAGRLGNGSYAGAINNNAAFNYASSAAQTFSGVISGTGSLTNAGPGTLTLSGVNTYTGNTTLTAGTLVGVTAGACGSSSVTVATTAATLGIAISDNTQSWSCSNLTFAAAGTLDYNFGAITPGTTVSPLVVSHAVTFTATPAVTLRGVSFASLPVGSYPLMTWGSVSGTVPTTVTLPPHSGAGNLSVSGNTLYLNITATGTEPLYWAAGSGTWDLGLSSNWKDNAGSTTAFFNSDSVVFEDSLSGSSPIVVTLAANVVPTSVTFSNNTKSYTLSGPGAITGAIGVTMAGAGTFVLANTNTYGGVTTVAAGTLQLGDGTANNGAVAGNIAISNGAALAFANPNAQTYAGIISGEGAATQNGPGTLTLAGANTYLGTTTVSHGTLAVGVTRSGTASALGLLDNTRTVTVAASSALEFTAANTLGGHNTQNAPTLVINGGTASNDTAGNNGLWNVMLNNGTLTSTNGSASTVGAGTDPNRTYGAWDLNGTVTSSGSSLITTMAAVNGQSMLSSVSSNGVAATIFDVLDGTLTVAVPLIDGDWSGQASGLTKTGAGSLVLTGVNAYTGATTVSGGALIYSSSSAQTLAGSISGSGLLVQQGAGDLSIGDGVTDRPMSCALSNNTTVVFTVATAKSMSGALTGTGLLTKQGPGTLTLTATNPVTESVQVSDGTLLCTTPNSFAGPITVDAYAIAAFGVKRLTPTGSVSASSLNLPGNGTLNFDLNQRSLNSTPLLTVSGALTNTGTLTVNLLNVNTLAVAAGTYPLLTYGSFVDGGGSSYSLTPISSQISAYITNDLASKTIALVVTAADYLRWTGATDTNWDSSTANWVLNNAGTPANYLDGGTVVFNDVGNNTAINLAISPAPGAIFVTNAATAYSFSGYNAIYGSGALTKQGPGTLTLANGFNTYSGQTLISGGTLILGDGITQDTSVTGPIENDATLVFNVLYNNTPPAISGTGSVTKNGTGTLTLSTPNSYTNTTTINNGIVQVGDSAALGTADGGTTVNAGGELDLTAGGLSIAEPLTLSGTGMSGGGALQVQSAIASTWSGSVTATADTLLAATVSGSSLNFQNTLNAGNNALIFNPVNGASFTVSSNIVAGSLVLSNTATSLGGLILTAANDSLTNIQVAGAFNTGNPNTTVGLVVRHSEALGTNSSVTLTNAFFTGGSGADLILDNNVTIPAGVGLQVFIPGDGAAGPATYRATLATGLTAGTTNIWNGPITIHGADPITAQVGLFQLYANNGNGVINGPITLADGNCTVLLRGASGNGFINGIINLGTNNLWRADPAVWTIASTGNTWSKVYWNYGTFVLGINDAFCVTAPVEMDYIASASGNPQPIWEMNGFNQQVAGLFTGGSGTAYIPLIRNSSTNSASTLKVYSTIGTNWMFGGTLGSVGGAMPLNLDVAGDTLTLVSNVVSTYTGSTMIRSGATLALAGGSGISATTPIDVQAGGTFDVSGTTSGGFTLGAGQTLKGKGTVNGSLSVAGTVAPGESVGTLTVTADVALGGAALMEVDNAAGTNDVLNVGGTLTYGGTLFINNISSTAYTVNQVIKLFNAGTYAPGAFANIVFPGVATYDASNLAVNGTVQVLTLGTPVNPNPTNIVATVSGNQLTMSWPADHTGWTLEVQTNALSAGLNPGGTWYPVSGSSTTNSMTIMINPADPTVFYRLMLP